MGIFSRMSDIINSNINAMLDKAEDPEKIVRLIIQEMEDTLVEVRSAAARAIADKKELSRTTETLQREANDWQRKAELAVSKGRDDLAKAALLEKSRVNEAVASSEKQLAQIEEGLVKLNDDIAALQAKLADARLRQKALVMRHSTAANRLQARSRIYDERINVALSRFDGFEQKMDHLEGKVEAYDLGRKTGDLKSQFVELESTEQLDEELEALKRRVGGQKQAATKD